jgi:gas vesicle protein
MGNKNISSSCFLIGLGTGITLGIFLAPRSGRTTRHFVSRKAQEGTEMLKAKVAAGRDYIERQGAELRDRAKDVVGTGTSRGD